jgi:glycosyltransferase involved in cell wall biosynthesis
MKKVSIVVPMYNEEAMVELFLSTLIEVIKKEKDYEFEIVAINDGSKDETLNLLYEAMKKYPMLRVVNLSRNFGHESAVAAGLSVASGDAVIPIDADLQDPPEVISGMLELFAKGYDVVNARRASRKEDTFIKRYTANKFYKVLDRISGKVKVPQNVGHFRLISRRVCDEVVKLTESSRVFRVQVPYVGYKTGEVVFARPKRPKGESHYNFASMFDLAFNSIISTTIKPVYWPLKLAVFLAIMTGLSFVTELTLFLINLFNNSLLVGVNHPLWLVINMILLVGTFLMFALGLIAIYVGKTFIESQKRPFFIIESIKENKK